MRGAFVVSELLCPAESLHCDGALVCAGQALFTPPLRLDGSLSWWRREHTAGCDLALEIKQKSDSKKVPQAYDHT